MTMIEHAAPNSFAAQAQSVIDWNTMQYAGDMIPFANAEKIAAQESYIMEEAGEIMKGIEEMNAKEVLDGVCDTFVTAVFMPSLTRKTPLDIDDLSTLDRADRLAKSWANNLPDMTPYDICGLMNTLARAVATDPHNLVATMKLCHMVELMGVNVPDAIGRVMQSNWTKFPTAEALNRTPFDECRWIEENRNATDVAHIQFAGRLVFRNKGGTGKIMKPSTFVEPELKDRDVSIINSQMFSSSRRRSRKF